MSHLGIHHQDRALWRLVEAQHGVVSHGQLRACGLTAEAIKHRLATGRLHRLYRGVYAVGRPGVAGEGRWMAAVLACGDGAAISHWTATALWELSLEMTARRALHVSIPCDRRASHPGLRVHRRVPLALADVTVHRGIPVTSPARTILDVAPGLAAGRLERLVSEADKQDLVTPGALLAAAVAGPTMPGAQRVRQVLGRTEFRLTASELESRFLELVARAGLPLPETGARVSGVVVDFYWPQLGLVVETDGLR